MDGAGGEKEQQGSEFGTVFQLEREKVQRENDQVGRGTETARNQEIVAQFME